MNVLMPQLGETVTEGKILAWLKSPGEKISVGDDLFEVETDKVTIEVQAVVAGVLSDLRVSAGETVKVGTIPAEIFEVSEGKSSRVSAHPVASETFSPQTSPVVPKRLDPFAEVKTPAQRFGTAVGPFELKVTPIARRLIAQKLVDIEKLAAKAKERGDWRIGKAEVNAYLGADFHGGDSATLSSQGTPPQKPVLSASSADYHAPFSGIRRKTAERLLESWRTIPHAFQSVPVNYFEVEKARFARGKEFLDRYGATLTYLPFVARAVCLAIAEFPKVNSKLDSNGLTIFGKTNLGIAVDLSHEGLVVPVIRDAGRMNFDSLSNAIVSSIQKVRSGTAGVDDFSGATYTISNNGAYGTHLTTPIINPPQVAILSLDAVRKQATVVEGGGVSSIAVQPLGMLGQSFDHRAFDGAYSAAFLSRVKQLLESHDWLSEF